MRPAGPPERFLAHLDADLARNLEGSQEAVLAFSGGLGSLILAAMARKRREVHCIVVGTRGSADVEAALLAGKFLDYPVEVARPTPAEILTVARAVRASDSQLPPQDVLALIPLAIIEERHPGSRVLSGFALAPRSAALRRVLVASRVRSPGLRRMGTQVPMRRLVLGVAASLGIPDSFALGSRRTPAEGSGVGPALRALGHARHVTIGRLLDELV